MKALRETKRNHNRPPAHWSTYVFQVILESMSLTTIGRRFFSEHFVLG
jgi:hypothetical protein